MDEVFTWLKDNGVVLASLGALAGIVALFKSFIPRRKLERDPALPAGGDDKSIHVVVRDNASDVFVAGSEGSITVNKGWDAAEAIFSRLQAASPAELYALYLERIAAFRADPPGESWDGVFIATSK